MGVLDIFKRRDIVEAQNARAAEEAAKKHRKIIVVIDQNGVERKYADIPTACRILKLNEGAVRMCLAGAQSTHKGYRFKEVEI